jgi:hypothetical protein
MSSKHDIIYNKTSKTITVSSENLSEVPLERPAKPKQFLLLITRSRSGKKYYI